MVHQLFLQKEQKHSKALSSHKQNAYLKQMFIKELSFECSLILAVSVPTEAGWSCVLGQNVPERGNFSVKELV